MRWIVATLALGLLACVPWTVVPIDEERATQPASDPKAYVESVWDSRLLPAAEEEGLDLATAIERLTAGEGTEFLVNGSAAVLELDASSRTGRLLLDVEPSDGEADAHLLVGPVILGTALRDAAGFIEFSEFTNQLAFADVANELNRRVVEEVVAGVDIESLPGKTVAFTGAVAAGAGGVPEIVPLRLEVR